ncbi:hypothetical protein [Paraburkholderia sartisoli]|uniref:hypothetical protein n=1 Tax=Paraburkholderia sartisoli TaxID=83784 RepID=UPI0015A3B1BD|nr:hypothetical protein [Paraburkholderia sartisoli]
MKVLITEDDTAIATNLYNYPAAGKTGRHACPARQRAKTCRDRTPSTRDNP